MNLYIKYILKYKLENKFKYVLLLMPVIISTGVLFLYTSYNSFAQNVSTTVNIVEVVCGDNVAELWEECDGIDLRGGNCTSLGYVSGDLSCTGACTYNVSGCNSTSPPSPGGGGGASYSYGRYVKETRIIINGTAYPEAEVDLLQNSIKVQSVFAGKNGEFSFNKKLQQGGDYSFGVIAEDVYGAKSTMYTTHLNVSSKNTTIINGIVLAPTLYANKTIVKRGGNVTFFGQSVPFGIVEILNNNKIISEAIPNISGAWKVNINSSKLDGNIIARTNVDIGVSGDSASVHINIGSEDKFAEIISKIRGLSDINKDSRIDLADFSILMYWYGKKIDDSSQQNKYIVDLNNDGIIDMADFSILVFYWTG